MLWSFGASPANEDDCTALPLRGGERGPSAAFRGGLEVVWRAPSAGVCVWGGGGSRRSYAYYSAPLVLPKFWSKCFLSLSLKNSSFYPGKFTPLKNVLFFWRGVIKLYTELIPDIILAQIFFWSFDFIFIKKFLIKFNIWQQTVSLDNHALNLIS